MIKHLSFESGVKLLIMVALVGAVALVLTPFWVSMALGVLLTVTVFPFYQYVMSKWALRPFQASLITIGAFVLLVVIPTVLVGIRGARITASFIETHINAPNAQTETRMEWFGTALDSVSSWIGVSISSPEELFRKGVQMGGQFLLKAVSQFFSILPELTIGFVIALLIAYFGLAQSESLKQQIARYSFLRPANAELWMLKVAQACRTVIISNLITGSVQATLIATVAALSGAGDFFVVGFLTFVGSFVPLIGAGPIGLLLAVVQLVSGNYGAAVAMLVVSMIAGGADNVLRPYLMSGDSSVHPVLSFLSVFGGIFLFGLPGLFLGPLIVSIGVASLPIYWADLQEQEVEPTA